MKYYFKKNIGAIVVSFIFIVFSLIFCIVGNESKVLESDLKIKKYDINLKINKDGSVSFDNYITYDFDDVDYTVIYEDIGYKKEDIFAYQDINNNKMVDIENKMIDYSSFDESSFSTRAFQNGKEIQLTQVGYSFRNDVEMDTGDIVSAPSYYQERIFCYLEEGYNEDTTFNFKYKINGVVSKYEDIGVINWILSPQTDVPIKNLSVNITFEEVLNNEHVEYIKDNFYVHGNVRITSDVNVTNDGITFGVEKQTTLQSVEVRMGFDKELVNNCDEKNTYNYNAQQYLDAAEKKSKIAFDEYNNRYFLIQTILFIATPLLIALVVFIWYSAYKKYDKERVSTFDSEYYRELPATYPPAELGYLYNFKETTKDDLSATIMDLIRRGYIELDTNGESTLEKKPNYIYRINRAKSQGELKSYERFVLEWYFKNIAKGDALSMDYIDEYLKEEANAKQYLNDNKKFIRLVREESRKNKFFDEFKNLSTRYILVYLLLVGYSIMTLFFQSLNYYTYALIFTAIGASLFILLTCYISNIKRRSESGNEDYVRWEAFKNFLLNFGSFDDYTMPLIEIWEHYLVYAVSFGIADKVEEQMRLKFKSLGEDTYNEYVSSSNIYYSRSYVYVSRSCSNSTTLAKATISQAQAARASSSGGSFGGGRSFGGGGGGHGGR